MDYRNRKYYLVKLPCDTHNEYIKELKSIKSVKIHNPHDFNKDSFIIMQVQSVCNCLVGFSSNMENSIKAILKMNREYNYRYPKYIEITKEKISQ